MDPIVRRAILAYSYHKLSVFSFSAFQGLAKTGATEHLEWHNYCFRLTRKVSSSMHINVYLWILFNFLWSKTRSTYFIKENDLKKFPWRRKPHGLKPVCNRVEMAPMRARGFFERFEMNSDIPNECPLTDFSLASLIHTLLTLCTFCRELLTVKRLGLIVKKSSDFSNLWRRRFVEIITRQNTETNFHSLRAALLAVVLWTDAKVISYGKRQNVLAILSEWKSNFTNWHPMPGKEY